MMNKIILILCLFLWLQLTTQAQVKIGGNGAPSTDAMLELAGTNGGFVPPRINLTNRTMNLNGGTPADGMVIYSTNATTGVGLYTWYNNGWNRLYEKPTIISFGKFIGRNTYYNDPNSYPKLQWDPIFTKQPDGLQPMWLSSSPTRIWIRTTGLYLISASCKKRNTNLEYLFLMVNGSTRFSYVRYYSQDQADLSLSSTTLYYFQAGDYFDVGTTSRNADTTLGTTQLAISQIPLTY